MNLKRSNPCLAEYSLCFYFQQRIFSAKATAPRRTFVKRVWRATERIFSQQRERDVGEVWLSPEKGVVMRESDANDGWSWEITTIQFRDPPAGSFELPRGFIEVQE